MSTMTKPQAKLVDATEGGSPPLLANVPSRVKRAARRGALSAMRKTSWKLDLAMHKLHHAEALERFEARPDDVFVVSFQKSGTTLLQMMAYQLLTDGSMEFRHFDAVSPYLEHTIWRDLHPELDRLPGPRILKTHLLREELGRLPEQGRWIYLLRNPGDALESFYHHTCLLMGVEQPREQFFARCLEGSPHYGSWFEHVESWWPHRHDDNVLFLRFHEVVADLDAAIEQTAAFCEVSLDEQTRQRVRERCSFDFMKAHNAKFDPRLATLQREPSDFIRQGKTRTDWRSLIPENLLPLLDERLASAAKKLDTSVDALAGV